MEVTGSVLKVAFISQRTKMPLFITVNAASEMSILTDSMDTAGDVLQSLAAYLNMEHLNVQADFPADMAELGDILTKVGNSHLLVVCPAFVSEHRHKPKTEVYGLSIRFALLYMNSKAALNSNRTTQKS